MTGRLRVAHFKIAFEHVIKIVDVVKMRSAILRRLFHDAHLDHVVDDVSEIAGGCDACLLYTSPSPRDKRQARMPSSA